ncbi:Uncharacterised protein [Mycobacteroides abscessus subsp. massiliense]|nr:Uncharacterised protein [Mycobacteroides abscessus subsp. massiliense]
MRLTHDTAGLDQVAEVDGGGELFMQQGIVDKQLHLCRPVAQLREKHTAIVTDAQQATADDDLGTVGGGQGLRDGVAGR